MTAHLIRRATDRACQQPRDPFLQHRIGGQPDGVFVALHLQQFVDLGVGEGGVTPEVAALHPVPIRRQHRLQYLAPAIGAVHIAGPQSAAFQISERVEHEQRVIAGAAEMTVVGAAFLRTVGLAHTAVHVEHGGGLRLACMHAIDPGTGQIGQGR